MIRQLLVTLAAACGLLAVSGPAFAAQPYPLNFHTFDLSSGSVSGLTYDGGSLTLAGNGVGSHKGSSLAVTRAASARSGPMSMPSL